MACGKLCPVQDGVIRFIDDDSFYEGAYQNFIRFVPTGSVVSELGFYVLNTHHLWWVRKWVPEGSRLMELGSGSGARFLALHTQATAVDLSFASLKGVHEGYRIAVQADAMALPFRDASYDAIVSTYFWEHIRPEDKPPMLAEFRRVLRPGGRMVFLFDVASQNPLFRWFRRSPELYRECIVENDHHYGLESPEANLAHFEAAGFRVLAKHLANKTPIQHLPVYAWARAYDHPITNAASRLAGIVSARPIMNRAYTVGVTLFDDLVEPLFPNDWARLMLVALERGID